MKNKIRNSRPNRSHQLRNVANAVPDAEMQAAILIRNSDKDYQFFGYRKKLEIIQRFVLNTALLRSLAEERDFVIYAVNVPYDQWNTEGVET